MRLRSLWCPTIWRYSGPCKSSKEGLENNKEFNPYNTMNEWESIAVGQEKEAKSCYMMLRQCSQERLFGRKLRLDKR